MFSLDFDQRENDRALAALGATAHPTIVLLDARGERVRTLIGRQTDETLRPAVEALIAEAADR